MYKNDSWKVGEIFICACENDATEFFCFNCISLHQKLSQSLDYKIRKLNKNYKKLILLAFPLLAKTLKLCLKPGMGTLKGYFSFVSKLYYLLITQVLRNNSVCCFPETGTLREWNWEN